MWITFRFCVSVPPWGTCAPSPLPLPARVAENAAHYAPQISLAPGPTGITGPRPGLRREGAQVRERASAQALRPGLAGGPGGQPDPGHLTRRCALQRQAARHDAAGDRCATEEELRAPASADQDQPREAR